MPHIEGYEILTPPFSEVARIILADGSVSYGPLKVIVRKYDTPNTRINKISNNNGSFPNFINGK
jgi:hypothetical protein